MALSLLLVFLWRWKMLPKEGKEIFVGRYKYNQDFKSADFLMLDIFWGLFPRIPLTNDLVFVWKNNTVLMTFNSIVVSAMNGIMNGVYFAALLAQRLPSTFGCCLTERDTDLHPPFCPCRKTIFWNWGRQDTILCSTQILLVLFLANLMKTRKA